MAITMYTERLLLYISVTINICILSYFLTSRVITKLLQAYCNKGPVINKLHQLNTCKPWLAGKIFTEQLSLWTLVVFAGLTLPETINQPFRLKNYIPSTTEYILAINIGRYLYVTAHDIILMHELTHWKTSLDFTHNVVTVISYVLFLEFQQNLFLCVAGIILEVNLIWRVIHSLMIELNISQSTTGYRNFILFGAALTFSSRAVLPVLFVTLSLKHQTPFCMDSLPLVVFFLCVVFYFVVNFWVIFSSFHRLFKVWYSFETESVITHNILDDSTLCLIPFKLEPPMSNFIRTSENSNIAPQDKYNLLQNKVLTKESIMYKLCENHTFLPATSDLVNEVHIHVDNNNRLQNHLINTDI